MLLILLGGGDRAFARRSASAEPANVGIRTRSARKISDGFDVAALLVSREIDNQVNGPPVLRLTFRL